MMARSIHSTAREPTLEQDPHWADAFTAQQLETAAGCPETAPERGKTRARSPPTGSGDLAKEAPSPPRSVPCDTPCDTPKSIRQKAQRTRTSTPAPRRLKIRVSEVRRYPWAPLLLPPSTQPHPSVRPHAPLDTAPLGAAARPPLAPATPRAPQPAAFRSRRRLRLGLGSVLRCHDAGLGRISPWKRKPNTK